ncbi:hypothetical protein R6Q59_027755 [Mikania micrantha]
MGSQLIPTGWFVWSLNLPADRGYFDQLGCMLISVGWALILGYDLLVQWASLCRRFFFWADGHDILPLMGYVPYHDLPSHFGAVWNMKHHWNMD